MASFIKILGLLLLPFWYFIESFFETCRDLFVPVSLRNLKDLSAEVALVTGGGAGLGRNLAIQLAELKVTVVTWDIDQSANEETVCMILDNGGSAYAYTVDISNPEAVYAAAERVKGEVGEVTLLVNNAAIGRFQSIWEVPDDLIQKKMNIIAIAPFWLLRAFLPSMKAHNHGHIVTTSSASVFMVPLGMGAHVACKSAALGLHQSVQRDLAFEKKTGIHMTLVFPGPMATTMRIGRIVTGKSKVRSPEEVAQQVIQAIRLNIPEYFYSKKMFLFFLFKNFIPAKLYFLAFRLAGVTSLFLNNAAEDKKEQ